MSIVDSIAKLTEIFRTNGWDERDIDEYVFNQFCLLLNNLSEEEAALILELTERYTWISFTEYNTRIINSFESIELKGIEQIKKIYLFPVIKPEDEGKTKSGAVVCYFIKGLKSWLAKFRNITFEFPHKFDFFDAKNFTLKEGETIFLVDDYIGSGETLQACLDEILLNKKITNNNINIVSLACQKEIKESITNLGIYFHSNSILKRGISDYNDAPDLDRKINLMLEIEKLIPGGKTYNLGYNRSEALITLGRTPDNTFPIFWKTHKKGKDKFEAPFSRIDF